MTIKVAPGLASREVRTTLTCSKGGEFRTALNLGIFLAVWRRLFQHGVFRKHDWTVKVDPDCVFFPRRLRSILLHRDEGPVGAYLNNCKMGMHGPIEVYSRKAVQTWTAGIDRCVAHFNKLCSGDCKWGEDLFIDQCLWKVLHVRRENAPSLLREDHCDPPPGWKTCRNQPSVVAFHPFKSVSSYTECMTNADQAKTATVRVLK